MRRVWLHYRQRTDIRKVSFALNEVAILSHHSKLELGPSKAAKLREILSEQVTEISGAVVYKSGDERRHEVDYDSPGVSFSRGDIWDIPASFHPQGSMRMKGNVRGLEQ